MSPDATDAAGPAPKVYDSPELQKVRAAIKEKLAAVRAETDDEKSFALNEELFNLRKEERGELAKLKAAEAQAELDARRSERVKLLDDLLAMHIANTSMQADKKASTEDKAASQSAFDAAREVVANELLAKYAKPVSAGTGVKTGATSAKAEQIVEWYKGFRASGNDHTAALKAVTDTHGVPKGSAWGPVNKYRISIGEVVKA